MQEQYFHPCKYSDPVTYFRTSVVFIKKKAKLVLMVVFVPKNRSRRRSVERSACPVRCSFAACGQVPVLYSFVNTRLKPSDPFRPRYFSEDTQGDLKRVTRPFLGTYNKFRACSLICTLCAFSHTDTQNGYRVSSYSIYLDTQTGYFVSFFDVLLTVHLSIFISEINQLDAQNFCFTISLFHVSTCFEHMCSKHVET